jgi:diguanylate cyclase (GGDEF)-like protein/PAS domain S-box-containing protein
MHALGDTSCNTDEGIERNGVTKINDNKTQEVAERLRRVARNAPVGMALKDAAGRVLWSNPALRNMLGYKDEELRGMFRTEFTHPKDTGEDTKLYEELLRGERESFRLEKRYIRKDGSIMWGRLSVFRVEDEPNLALVVVEDVNEHKEAEEALRRSEASLAEAQRLAHLGSWEWHPRTGELYWSDEVFRIYGLAPQQFVPTFERLLEAVHPDDRELLSEFLDAALHKGEPYDFEHRVVRPSGEVRWVHRQAEVVRAEGGEPLRMVGTVHDITERKALEEQLEHQAFHDSLTDLPNRHLFMDRLGQTLKRTKRRRKRKVALLFMDLDNFKVINDSLGHELGDELLVAVAERLRSSLRPEDTLARFGGDEFSVLIEDVDNPEDVARVAERIVEDLREPFVIDGRELFVRASIGIALGDAHTKSSEDLLRDADIAMYRAKADAADYQVFDPDMYERTLERLELENNLSRALEREEFRVYYQPKFRLGQKDRVEGIEALVRWEHPQRGPMLPEDFIPVAEETGLIITIGGWVMREACRQAKEWQERYPSEPSLSVCVNLSAGQVRHPGLLQDVSSTLQESGLEAGSLILEITEGTLLKDTELIETIFGELKALGVRLVIDDFGKEYSSLSYLKRLPVDGLKIDDSFVESLGEDPTTTTIVEAVISLAHSLELEVTGEGVESAEQLEHLRRMGCNLVQGTHLARPLPCEEVESLLADRSN